LKRFLIISLVCFQTFAASAVERPLSYYVEGQTNHIQGIAFDSATSNMYMSFTTRFLIVNPKNRIIGSIDSIHGHLGAMTFDAPNRKIYASLECKNDEIGTNISKGLGMEDYTESTFYIAEIDVDAVNRPGTSQKDAVKCLPVPQAAEDYGKKYGCTGIDGITTGPDFGGKGGEFLYVAYGIKSDTTRNDNDYQVLLQYKMSDIRKGDSSSPKKFFVKTGNTSYGVQNLAYDPFTGLMFMAVYKGQKKQYANYDLFAIDMASKPVFAKLDGVPYEHKPVATIPLACEGWHFKYGSMGLHSLGDGYWYIAEGGKKQDPSTGRKLRTGKAVLYRWVLGSVTPFKKVGSSPAQGSFTQKWKKGPEWLKDAVIYQIYPSSFKDSDGDGIGDLKGIMSKLDYIASLGVECIWLNPIFLSDFIDGGYDVIDFYKVDPRFGSNSDLVELVKAAHCKGIKVMLDLVAGHTSDKCEWFTQSAQGRDLRYSDYYVWSGALPDKKAENALEEMLKDPNPMQSTKGKWMKSEYPRDKYYMKNFYACQPALNYGFAKPDPSHPWEQGVNAEGPKAVRNELMNIMSFWLGKGVDGFRVDMANSLVKNDKDRKETIKLWRGIRQWMDRTYPNRVLMAEWGNPMECLAAGFNVDMDLNPLNSATRFMYFDNKHQSDGGCYFSADGGSPAQKDLYGKSWPAETIDRSVTAERMLANYYAHMTECLDKTKEWGWFASMTGNHDHLRMNTGSRNTPAQLKVMMTWIMCMPLPILYYGDEIGMRSLVGMPSVEGANHNGKERAGARTPMQWTSDATAGFSNCIPDNLYLPVCPCWTSANTLEEYLRTGTDKSRTAEGAPTVQSQENDPSSLLNWTRSLIALRKANNAFHADSSFEPVKDGSAYPMCFKRSDGKSCFVVILNPTSSTHSIDLGKDKYEAVLHTGGIKISGGKITLPQTSAAILKKL